MMKFKSTMTTPPSGDGLGWKYVQKETGVIMRSHQWTAILDQVKTHRSAMGIPLEDGWMQNVEHDATAYNDSESHEPGVFQPFVSELEKMGRSLWKELHSFGSPDGDWSPLAANLFLDSWEQRIPNFDYCDCRESYGKMRVLNPPGFQSYESFHSWGIKIHNLVNQKVGKAIWAE